jgi:hypothetical protein
MASALNLAVADTQQDRICVELTTEFLTEMNKLEYNSSEFDDVFNDILIFGENCDQRPLFQACASKGYEECQKALNDLNELAN